MSSKQMVVLIGRVGREPEMRYTPKGDAITKFSLATDESWTQDGKKHKVTAWWNINAWGKLGEVVNEWVHKGALLEVIGKIQVDPETHATKIWKDKDGNSRTSLDLKASEVTFLVLKDAEGEEAEAEDEDSYERHEHEDAKSSGDDDEF